MGDFEPAYLKLWAKGGLRTRAEEARRRLEPCDLCARGCGAARLSGGLGDCNTGERAVVCSFHPHFGEEAPLVGRHGSGTIFFSWCNLHCQFCQNCELSAQGQGRETVPSEIAEMMLALQAMGCHNVNVVSPSHVVPQIVAALLIAAEGGLSVPLVYNTGGYDALDTLRLLDGIVDIYMPDMKYADAAAGERFSRAPNYPEVNRAAVREMHRQVGDLMLDDHGVALRGLLVRHLVLPGRMAGTGAIVRFLADEISTNTYINIMDQYRPCYNAADMPPLNRRVTPAEYREAVRLAQEAGLHRLDDRYSRGLAR
jgi:putative pyruvate formate lyase activating enzyme